MEKDELIKSYEKLKYSDKVEDLFIVLDLITMLQDDDKLDAFIGDNREKLLKNNPLLMIGKHVHYYLSNDRIYEGLEVLTYYQNAPFISVEVEDFMKELKEEIVKSLKPKNKKNYFDETLLKDLYSDNEQCLARAIRYLSESNIRLYLDEIKKCFLSKMEYRYKILIQFILIEQHVAEKFIIKKDDGEEFEFVPVNYRLPFEEKDYIECINYLNSLNESPSVIQMAIEILNNLQIKTFPFSFFKKVKSPLILGEIVLFMAKRYLDEDISFESISLNTDLDQEEIENYIFEIEKMII